jgi:hypothetical protein
MPISKEKMKEYQRKRRLGLQTICKPVNPICKPCDQCKSEYKRGYAEGMKAGQGIPAVSIRPVYTKVAHDPMCKCLICKPAKQGAYPV